MLAAMLTVSGPWLPARWRHWWWALLLAFVPIHLVVSAVVPARSLLGLAVGWFVGALVVLVRRHPGTRGAARRRRAGDGPARMHGDAADGGSTGRTRVVDHDRRLRRRLDRRRRDVRAESAQRRGAAPAVAKGETARRRNRAVPGLDAPHRRASRADGYRHRRSRVANTSPLAVAPLDRGWTLYAQTPARGTPLDEVAETTLVARGSGGHCGSCTITRSPTEICVPRRSPSTTASRCSAGSTSPSTAPPTRNCSRTSRSCW